MKKAAGSLARFSLRSYLASLASREPPRAFGARRTLAIPLHHADLTWIG
jgi:hypothetical protein